MHFVFLILRLLVITPVVYVWQCLKRGKLLMALTVILMSPYMIIAFVFLGVYTSWWIGLLSAIAYMILVTIVNWKLSMSRLSRMTEDDWEKGMEKGFEYAEALDKSLDPYSGKGPSVIRVANATAKAVIDLNS